MGGYPGAAVHPQYMAAAAAAAGQPGYPMMGMHGQAAGHTHAQQQR